MAKPRVSACIVNYRCLEKTRVAVRTMLEQTAGVELTVYVVDNASGDDALGRLKAEFPQIVTVQNPKNGGFGYGHNAVLDMLDSDYHCVVNPDITFDRDTISTLCAYLDAHPDVGIVTPEIRFPNGEIQVIGKRNPTFWALFGRHLFREKLKGVVEHYQMLDEDLTRPIDIQFATGCFFVIRTETFRKIGGFDERFFLYFEDMDLTRMTIERAGLRAVYDPETYVYHAWERASSHHPKYFVILVLSMFKYFGKWGWAWK